MRADQDPDRTAAGASGSLPPNRLNISSSRRMHIWEACSARMSGVGGEGGRTGKVGWVPRGPATTPTCPHLPCAAESSGDTSFRTALVSRRHTFSRALLVGGFRAVKSSNKASGHQGEWEWGGHNVLVCGSELGKGGGGRGGGCSLHTTTTATTRQAAYGHTQTHTRNTQHTQHTTHTTHNTPIPPDGEVGPPVEGPSPAPAVTTRPAPPPAAAAPAPPSAPAPATGASAPVETGVEAGEGPGVEAGVGAARGPAASFCHVFSSFFAMACT
jgi:hypothetical protein